MLVYLAIPGLNGTPLIFTLLPFMPLMFRMLIWEEKEEEAQLRRHESGFFDYHKVLLESYAYIFVGAILASMIWYGVLMQVSPEIAHNAFENEVQEIVAISNTVNQSSASTANVLRSDFFDFFGFLFGHNIQVLALMLLFSLLYGVGSLYLLLWNASVIGIFIAQRVFELGIINGLLGSFLGLLPHGMFELSAYFVASIAGGIFSVAVMRRHLERPELRKVLLDSFFLLLLSVGLVFIGALIESSY